MKLSIVTTLYRSSPYVTPFYERMTATARSIAGDEYEIIMVNDGSPDDSLTQAVRICEEDSHVSVVDLSRNFGHHKAMMTGLSYSTGDSVFLIDSDLEEEPEWLTPFTEHRNSEQCDVVFGVQNTRRGGFAERITGPIYYRLFRLFTGINQPNNIVTARLMSRRYVDSLLMHKEREINIGGLWCITGYLQRPLEVIKHSSSPTTYSVSLKLNQFINSITSFSSLPLEFTFYTGACISLSAVAYISYLVVRYLFISAPPDGYTSLIASIWLFSGLIIFFLGIQGIYLAKIFSEVKNRPYSIVRQVHKHLAKGKSSAIHSVKEGMRR
jgi:putative glycosyltransferase